MSDFKFVISFYITVFIVCHGVRWVPNVYELTRAEDTEVSLASLTYMEANQLQVILKSKWLLCSAFVETRLDSQGFDSACIALCHLYYYLLPD